MVDLPDAVPVDPATLSGLHEVAVSTTHVGDSGPLRHTNGDLVVSGAHEDRHAELGVAPELDEVTGVELKFTNQFGCAVYFHFANLDLLWL